MINLGIVICYKAHHDIHLANIHNLMLTASLSSPKQSKRKGMVTNRSSVGSGQATQFDCCNPGTPYPFRTTPNIWCRPARDRHGLSQCPSRRCTCVGSPAATRNGSRAKRRSGPLRRTSRTEPLFSPRSNCWGSTSKPPFWMVFNNVSLFLQQRYSSDLWPRNDLSFSLALDTSPAKLQWFLVDVVVIDSLDIFLLLETFSTDEACLSATHARMNS